MKIVIADSGFGGLSVCAPVVEELVRQNSLADVIYINMAPPATGGFNTISDHEQKVVFFNNALCWMHKRYDPDYVFIACNTLSVLLPETPWAKKYATKIEGIVSVGSDFLIQALTGDPDREVILLATPTTVSAQTYPSQIRNAGFQQKIHSQPCPELATTISNDSEGKKISAMIHQFAQEVLGNMNKSTRLIIFLGCTHYGYREGLFEQVFHELGYPHVSIMNPNPVAVQSILSRVSRLASCSGSVTVAFVTGYAPPENEIRTIS
ncbi:MAG: aspartate/glutamate racemase family protein, partial [SAR324 cluster bacterium]|nr:aspartate/glutamate racemase family protein [SAR324 cluster bacterium]